MNIKLGAGKCHSIFARFTNSVVGIISIYNGPIYHGLSILCLPSFCWKMGGGGGLVIKPLLTVEPELSPLDNSSTRSGSG